MILDAHTRKRISELERDGFLGFVKGSRVLTEKGMAVLIAFAEPPIPKPMGRANERGKESA